LGNTLKLTLGATGSAPLSYQWYISSAEDPPIPGATSSSLVISNNFLQHTGQYQVWATVNNVAGGSTSQVTTVTVSLETNKPTIAITSPTSGQLWSNATFTVTGTASDKAGITSVLYSINNGASAEATTANNWANWAATNVVLTPGTNIISAIASNVGGITATTSVKFVYVQSAALTVITNGLGSITPINSGALLQIGKVFSLTAKGTDGFKFVNWTGGTNQPFSIYTNGPTVLFTMSNNLTMQANFVDTNKPFLSITNAKTGMLWSNAAFTVQGRATDNVAVASVNYSLNGGAFAPATTNGSSWSTGVTLVPGTNTFSAYAADTSGNVSTTDTVKIVYVLSATLTVQTNGMGVITPNDNGALLQIGKIFSLTATGKDGFKFTNWSGSTNGINGTFTVLTNGPTVTFTMESNLVFQANLVDTNKPFISITNVTSGMQVSNAAFTVMGRATDNVAVASVNFSLNSAPYATAVTNGSSWNAGVTLVPGTNTLSVYAADTSANISATDTVKIVYVPSATLTVLTNGMGIITPNDNGALLAIGKNYSLTAAGKDGFKFTNWSTGTSIETLTPYTNGATLQFTMVSNLVLQANLIDTNKPFLSITNVTSGMQVSNAAFTVMGRATDNVAVASVQYSLNGAAYAGAGLNGVSWNAAVGLNAGTNTFSAYAVDTSGNLSSTSAVKIVYIPSATLTVLTNGMGIITPNDNGALLAIGKNYSLTAKATDGFMFTNWSTGTSIETLIPYTNGATLQFTMISNLVLQANLIDTNKPFLSITNAKTGMLVTNMEFTIMGRATDNVAVASVYISLDGDAYSPTEAGGGSWSAGLEMTPGTNKFSAYAVDTRGNVSATNTITIIRVPTVTTFLIATNEGINHLQARIASDGTNYLVVYQGTNSGLGQFVSPNGSLIGGPLVLNPGGSDDPPCLDFDGTNYLVAWADHSDQGGAVPVKGAFVSPSGEVGAPITLSQSTTVDTFGTLTFGGGVYLAMWSDGRTGSFPELIYGSIINRSGGTNSEFLIGDGGENEVAQNQAAFDGTNFLAIWFSESGNLAINGQLIDTSGNLVGSRIQIYTNTAAAATAVPSVLFNGTNYLVLFNIGLNSATSSGYHVLGRFVTPSGQVLTNQITLTADAGPQVVGASAFDGFNYLMTWNQGFNPSAVNTSATINGRFFNPNAGPVSTEFPVFKTQGSLIPTWSPVFFDGTKFVLVGGLGKQESSGGFTNGVIYGAFVSP
jgi:hypothetical protein